jgi:predicted membrane protein
MAKRIVRAVVKVVALIAGAVFFFDNHISGTAGLILLASIAVLAVCGAAWVIFGLGEDNENTGCWPPNPHP